MRERYYLSLIRFISHIYIILFYIIIIINIKLYYYNIIIISLYHYNNNIISLGSLFKLKVDEDMLIFFIY